MNLMDLRIKRWLLNRVDDDVCEREIRKEGREFSYEREKDLDSRENGLSGQGRRHA